MPSHIQPFMEQNWWSWRSVTNILSVANTESSCNNIGDKEIYLVWTGTTIRWSNIVTNKGNKQFQGRWPCLINTVISETLRIFRRHWKNMNPIKLFYRKSLEKHQEGDLSHLWKHNIKMNLRRMVCGDRIWHCLGKKSSCRFCHKSMLF